jgi:DNA-binding transcriptional LysR family regulator
LRSLALERRHRPPDPKASTSTESASLPKPNSFDYGIMVFRDIFTIDNWLSLRQLIFDNDSMEFGAMDRLKLMETFNAVVKLGGYPRAAKELGVTRALISKRILELEEHLGVKLLNRNPRQLSVTGTGAEYYEACREVLNRVRSIEERLTEKQKVVKGDLKVLSSKTFGETTLAEIASEFSKIHNGVSVNIVLRDMAPHVLDLMSEGFDLAVRTHPIADSSLIMRKIARLPRVLVAAPEYLARNGMPHVPEDLLKFNCLNPDGSLHAQWRFTGPGGTTAVQVSGSPRANSSIIIRTAALKGLGLAMLPRYTVREALAQGSLVQVLKGFQIDARTLCVFYDRSRYLPVRTRLFIDYLARRMKRGFG